MVPWLLLVLLAASWPPAVHAEGLTAAGVISVLQLGKEIATSVIETWDLVEDIGDIRLPYSRGKDQKILRKLFEVSTQLQRTEDEIVSNVKHTVDELTQYTISNSRFENSLMQLFENVNVIAQRDAMMRSYVELNHRGEKVEDFTWETIAHGTVALEVGSISELMLQIHRLTTGSSVELPLKRPGLYEQVYMLTKEAKSTICSFGLSAQQVLFELYNKVSLTELKGYTMIQFSWMLLKAYGKGNFTTESKLMRSQFEERTARTQHLMQKIMQQASRDYWRCDPERTQVKEGETFLQMTRLLQGYIENEVDMNTENTCRETCAYYQYGNRQEQCYKELYCSKQTKCAGRIFHCEYVDSDMWICPSPTSSNRRYEYIEYENGMVRGQKNYCARGATKVDSWWRWLFWHCSYCFCLCDDNGPRSDRYINMGAYVSDIANNMVVTGLRFVKKNRIVHLIIQEGKLLPRGKIDNTTLTWKQPKDYNILSPNVRNGIDYHTLTYENRTIDLDDIDVPAPYVLTGVRFRLLGNHLNMEIRATEMDFVNGKLLDQEKSVWHGKDSTEHSEDRRTEVELKNPHVPILSPSKSVPNSNSNQFIRFRESDRNMDAAQTTVPFLDAQPVVSNSPVPLCGAGLKHKGQKNFGGFVMPMIRTYDFAPHLITPVELHENDHIVLPRVDVSNG